MRTWNSLNIDLEDTIPSVTNHGNCVSIHTAGYETENKLGRGLSVSFTTVHIPMLQEILRHLQEIDNAEISS